MTNIFKAAIVSLAVLAGASAASAGDVQSDSFTLDQYIEQQELHGGY